MKRYLLTLVALLAMTTGAWAQQTTVTWDTETWASGWTSDVKTHTVDGVTITVTGTAEAKNSSGNLYIYVDNSASNTLTFSSDIPIARIEMTKKSPSSSLYLSPKDGWSVSSDNTTVIWEGTATKSLVCKTCTLTVTKIKFFLEEPLIALDDTKTVATMAAMPAYDATVSYELVRDMQEKVEFLGIPTGNGATVKKDGDKYTFATAPIITLSDVLNPSEATTIFYYNDGFSYVESGLTLNVYPMVEMEGFPGYYKTDETATPVALTDFLASPQPGRWKIKATATTGPYDGTLYSPEFTLAEAYDLTLSPATDANLKSVTVAGTTKTADENGVIRGIEPTKKVKITTTGPDYIIRKAAVKKAGASGVLTGVINLDNLKEGDIMKDITGFTGNYVCITLKEGRYKQAGFTRDIPLSLVIPNITFNANGYTLTDDMDYTPVDENGQDGNAWIFLGIQSAEPVFGGYTLK